MASPWLDVGPEALYWAPRHVAQIWGGKEIYITEKGCAPYCTVSCVHYVSYFDFWRGEQTIKAPAPTQEPARELVQIQGPQ